MPVALMVHVRPQVAGSVSSNLGRAIHANVLRLVQESDPVYAQYIHDHKGAKPLTTSNMREFTTYHSHMAVSPDQVYSFRVTLLSSELEELVAPWSAQTLAPWNLDGLLWDVEDVICDAQREPWSGRLTYGQIANQTASQRPSTRWKLEFGSPLTFRQGPINQPLPLPVLVFGSLLDKWNSFAPLTFPDELRRFAEECVAISRFQLRSVAEPTKNNAIQIGSIGECLYTAINRDRYWCTCLDTLARFAFWSGVGAGATRGFGRTRLLNPSSNED